MSSSIREYLFSDVIVINPEWIKYHELRNLGVEYIEYSSFTDLHDIIINCINENIDIDFALNKELIFKNYSWEQSKLSWQKFIVGF